MCLRPKTNVNESKQERKHSHRGFQNARRVLIILHVQKGAPNTALLSFDAEEAFDKVEWSFLFEKLERFVLGENDCKSVKLLYNDP